MKKTMGWFVACALGLCACNVEHYEDCADDDFGDGFAGSHSKAGSTSTAGTATGGTTTTGGTTATGEAGAGDEASAGGAGAAPATPKPMTCDDEHDCAPGYNCNFETAQCEPAAEETCGELTTEAACSHRTDCTPVYAGINCSCGQDCACKGGEPGCVCESFDFFVCQAGR